MKPVIHVVSVDHVKIGTDSNNLTLEIRDGSGIARTLVLSPAAQETLIESLFATPPFETAAAGDKPLPHRLLIAGNTRAALMPDNEICLEVILRGGTTIHILLPGILPEATIQVLRQVMLPDGTPH